MQTVVSAVECILKQVHANPCQASNLSVQQKLCSTLELLVLMFPAHFPDNGQLFQPMQQHISNFLPGHCDLAADARPNMMAQVLLGAFLPFTARLVFTRCEQMHQCWPPRVLALVQQEWVRWLADTKKRISPLERRLLVLAASEKFRFDCAQQHGEKINWTLVMELCQGARSVHLEAGMKKEAPATTSAESRRRKKLEDPLLTTHTDTLAFVAYCLNEGARCCEGNPNALQHIQAALGQLNTQPTS
jgi:hypothetical protein